MIKDKFSAVWLSYSSIRDYLKCPRAYYLKNIYRDPKTHHKISLMQPALALGQVVHDVIEAVSVLQAELRFAEPLSARFERSWNRISGKFGGFRSQDEEGMYKERGRAMIERMSNHPGPLLRRAVKIRQDLPYVWLSEEENLILCGKIDWLEYIEASDSVKIIDFKTGKHDEDTDSLQLPIYYLLASETQERKVSGAAYWYLDRDDEPIDAGLPSGDEAREQIVEVGKRIALARKLERFVCPAKDGCIACWPMEAIVSGHAEKVSVNDFGQDVYILSEQATAA